MFVKKMFNTTYCSSILHIKSEVFMYLEYRILNIIKKIKIKIYFKKKRESLEELFKDYHGNYQPTEYDWGDPVGEEII